MWQKLQQHRNALKDRVAGLNPITIVATALALGMLILLSIKTRQKQKDWMREIRASQFIYSSEISHTLSMHQRQLSAQIKSARRDEKIFHLNSLLTRTKNDQYEPGDTNQFARLKNKNSGRFVATDNKGMQYKASLFNLNSFPNENEASFWYFNAETAAATAIFPAAEDIFVANIPTSWFHQAMQNFKNESDGSRPSQIPSEKFEWAIFAVPENETASTQSGTSQTRNEIDKTNQNENQQSNQFILASSDSLEFGPELSGILAETGILYGPNQYRSLKNSITEIAGITLTQIPDTNLKLLTKWTAKWSFIDVIVIYASDMTLLLILFSLFFVAASAYKIRFTKLTSELSQALIGLNPSKSVSLSGSKESKLEDTFNEIFDSAVWLYKIASQRQHKYGALAEFTKARITEHNKFLVYIDVELVFPDFKVYLNMESNWRIAFIQSPYVNGDNVFLIINADSSLARIIMYTFAMVYIQKTSENADAQEAIQNELENITRLAERLSLQAFCIIADAETLKNGSAFVAKSSNTLTEITVENEMAYIRNPEGRFDFCFTTDTQFEDLSGPVPSKSSFIQPPPDTKTESETESGSDSWAKSAFNQKNESTEPNTDAIFDPFESDAPREKE